MKKLKMLLEAGIIQSDKKLKALYKDFTAAKKELKKTEKRHLKSKATFKELEKDTSTEQLDLEAAYLERMVAKHLRSAAEYRYLLVESNLKQAINDLLKEKSIKKLTAESEDKSNDKSKSKSKSEKKSKKKSKKKEKSKSKSKSKADTKKKGKKVKKEKVEEESAVKTIRTVTVDTVSKTIDPFVQPKEEVKEEVKEATPKKRGPGRPPGAKNKKTAASATTSGTATKRGPGRPPGAKNKPKSTGKTTPTTRKKPGPKPKKRPVVKGDDLRLLEGVGPKAVTNLKACGFDTFAKIAEATPQELQTKLTEISTRMGVLPFDSIPAQAKLAAAGKWDELEAMKNSLNRGR